MGQKTNPVVLRIGKFSKWDSGYIEKKSLELPKQTFDNISIKSFLTKFMSSTVVAHFLRGCQLRTASPGFCSFFN